MEDIYDEDKCLSVQDVFDGVVEIAEGFEKIIDSQGDVEIVKGVLKKVIWSLEHLRNSVLLNERIECELSDLKVKISHLEYEKEEKAKLRKKFDEELEQIEEHWRKESKALNLQIAKLQQENQRLQKHQTESEDSDNENENNSLVNNTIMTLRETVDNQRNQLHVKEAEIHEKTGEVDALEKQLSRLRDLNEKLRLEVISVKRDNQCLLEEKLELQGKVQEYQRELLLLQNTLQEMLGAENNNVDEIQDGEFFKTPTLPKLTPAQLRRVLCEMNNVKLRVKYLEEEISFYRDRRPSLKMETDLAIKMEKENETENHIMENNIKRIPSEQLSESESDLESDQDSDDTDEDDITLNNSDDDINTGAEWVNKCDVPTQALVDREIKDKKLMSRRPSAINKFFRRIFSPFATQEERPMPMAYFSSRRASAGII